MEIGALQSRRPFCCSISGSTVPNATPLPLLFSQSYLSQKGFFGIRLAAPQTVSTSDFSRRWSRRSFTLKGFAPRPEVGVGIQKKNKSGIQAKCQGTLRSGEYTVPEPWGAEDISSIDILDEPDQGTTSIEGIRDEQWAEDEEKAIASSTQAIPIVDVNQVDGKEIIVKVHESTTVPDIFVENGADADEINQLTLKCNFSSTLVEQQMETVDEIGEQVMDSEDNLDKMALEGKHQIDSVVVLTAAEELENFHEVVTEKQGMEIEMDPALRKQLLEDLAEENLSRGNKVFIYPLVAEPDQVIQIFFDRSASALKNEPDVLIMGAFNDWRWKSYTEKMQRSDLRGDWWSCQLHVPKEAYKMNFVFFNGESIYENNGSKDFFISVEGGMELDAFKTFLLEEKRRELEKLAAEQAERERLAEEQRCREVENAARETDRELAKMEVEKKRTALRNVIKIALSSFGNVWQIEPSAFKGGDRIRLFYNRSSRPLAHAMELWIHGGHNNWNDGLSIVKRLFRYEKKDGDWWHVDVVVPDQALVLDWVFADGPLESAKVYDNNNNQDFHASVMNCISEELYWTEEEYQIFKKFQEERKMKEVALRTKIAEKAQMKPERKEKAMKMFQMSQKHILYTEPTDPQAGSTVTIFYNPCSTALSGKPDVWFTCSFNYWLHHNGPLPPQKMLPVDNGSQFKASVEVPLDAYIMDFVFSDKDDGGIYDNKNGMDYHIPVSGGVSMEPPMHIVHVAVEMAPIAKVGGLGDVVTSLSRAIQDLGHNVEVILPKYDCVNLSNVRNFEFRQSFAWGGTEIKVWHGKVEGLPVYFLEPQNGMFQAGCIYGCRNDGERFGFFCHAALEFLLQKGAHPDILHCHDWSSAPVTWLFKEHYLHYGLSNARVILTIHNLEFGGHFIGRAMVHADKATTVSCTYSREVSRNPIISPHLNKFHGILNGIDPDIWDPYIDNLIPIPYSSDNVVEGKKAAKEALQQRLGLSRSDYPLLGIITRLTYQKGIHLIRHAILRTLDMNGQVVLLGTAPDHRIQNEFIHLANQLKPLHGNSVCFCLTYDEPLSHLIFAGSDFILVPSVFEPCGLTQLIAMQYGSIPVVRKTGGLYDTVFDVDNEKERAEAQGLEPNGFSFDGADAAGVDYALDRAFAAWSNSWDWLNSLRKRVMEQDWSWNRPALDYMELYHAARKNIVKGG